MPKYQRKKRIAATNNTAIAADSAEANKKELQYQKQVNKAKKKLAKDNSKREKDMRVSIC